MDHKKIIIKKHYDLAEMINSKFPVLILQVLQPGKANKNSALVIEVVFSSAMLIVHCQLPFFNYHRICEYFCEEK